MKDFYGNEYIESRWTRFPDIGQVINFQDARTTAFDRWVDNVAAALYQRDNDVQVNKTWTKNFGGVVLSVEVFLPIAPNAVFGLSMWHYDTWTKKQLDPAEQILAQLSWETNFGGKKRIS